MLQTETISPKQTSYYHSSPHFPKSALMRFHVPASDSWKRVCVVRLKGAARISRKDVNFWPRCLCTLKAGCLIRSVTPRAFLSHTPAPNKNTPYFLLPTRAPLSSCICTTFCSANVTDNFLIIHTLSIPMTVFMLNALIIFQVQYLTIPSPLLSTLQIHPKLY